MKENKPSSGTQTVFKQILNNVHSGTWPVGSTIPGERTLTSDYSVSRIAIREALAMLRGLGVLDVSHGKRTRVKKVDSETLGQLLPLMLASSGQQSFDQTFEVRIALEVNTAFLAASRRTTEHLKTLIEIHEQFSSERMSDDSRAIETDVEFHITIAKITGNPLFPILLEAIANFVTFAQVESCKDDPIRSQKAVDAHAAILEAIIQKDPERAKAEMEAHLRYSASRRLANSLSAEI